MSTRALTVGLFLSIALNLFLVGLLAGGWRAFRDRTTPPGEVRPAAIAPAFLDPHPAAPTPPEFGRPDSPRPTPSPGRETRPPPPPGATFRAGLDSALSGGEDPTAPTMDVARPAEAPNEAPPTSPPGFSPQRPLMGNTLMDVARDLPLRSRQEFQSLLRAESEAVRFDLVQARRDRAEAWRGLARGELTASEARRVLDAARDRELAARSRVESAVAEWARRQSPLIRARVGEALAAGYPVEGRRPLRPPGPPPERRAGEAGN